MRYSGIEFRNRKEAEAYFRELAVDAFKTAVKVWEARGTMAASEYLDRKAFRRVPEIDGGLGLCPNLKEKK